MRRVMWPASPGWPSTWQIPGGRRHNRASERCVEACRRALELQIAANSGSVRLLQVCVLDHSSDEYEQPHLHVKCHFSDGTQAPWESVYNTNQMALRVAVSRLQPSLRVQVHVHQDEPPEDDEGPAGMSEDFFEALPKIMLEQRSADRLVADGTDTCTICLDEFVPGDEVLLFPCPGTHKAHASCSASWLANATTCPTCRFNLPMDLPSSRTLGDLLEPAHTEALRIREGAPPPCLPIDEETPELAECASHPAPPDAPSPALLSHAVRVRRARPQAFTALPQRTAFEATGRAVTADAASGRPRHNYFKSY